MEDRSGVSRRDYLRGIGAASVVAAGGLTGCSALGGDPLSDPQEYTIVATVPRSGQYSDVGEAMERGYTHGAEGENARATVMEFVDDEFDFVVRDDESDPERVTDHLEEIHGQEDTEINMIWGSYGVELSRAAASFAEEEEIPCLLPYAPHEAPYGDNGYEWTFGAGPTSSNIAFGTASLLDDMTEETRPSRIAIWEPNSGWGTELADRWEEMLDAADGEYEVVVRETFEPGTEDFGDLISTSMDEDAELLLSNPSQSSAIAAIEAMQSEGWAPGGVQFSWGADRPTWWEALGRDGEYVLSTPGWVQGSTRQGSAALLSRYGQTHGYSAEEGDLMPPAAGSAYAVTQVVINAFGEDDDVFDHEDIRDAIAENRARTVVGNIVYDEGSNGVPRATAMPGLMAQWFDGEDFEAGQRAAFGTAGDVSFSGLNYKYPMPAWDER